MVKKIMIVDDEENILELVKTIIESAGFEAITAIDGEVCLKKLESTKPDLILMDMMMPGMSGRETTEKIRKNPKTKDIKIAFLTVAKFSETGMKTLKSLKVIDYITKPFNNDDLVNKIKKIVK